MDREQVILALAALAQPTRLDAFQVLVAHEPHGMPAGDIARRLAVPHNTMSSHLSILARAGLVGAERRSRTMVYRARLEQFRAMAAYLLQDCCGGRPEVCEPLLDAVLPCCPPMEVVDA